MLIAVILQPLINIGLLFMFVRGLWILNRQMMQTFMHDHQQNSNNPTPTTSQCEISTATSTPIPRVSMNIVLDEWGKQKTITRNQTKGEIERMICLHNLIKKQTILVFIANVSTMTLWIAAVALKRPSILWETGWDNIVNSICVWMMLTESSKYWMLCQKYGLCWCCYRMTNDWEI